jgi:hypothetical protein
MVINRKSPQSGHHLIVHNIGAGPKMEDVLFNWRIACHYQSVRIPGIVITVPRSRFSDHDHPGIAITIVRNR